MVFVSTSHTSRAHSRTWLPSRLSTGPWPHLVWWSLLLFTDLQLWYGQGGLYYQETETGWHFLLKSLWIDAVDCALFYWHWSVLLPRLFASRRLGRYAIQLVGSLLLFTALRIGISVFYAEGRWAPTLAQQVQFLSSYHLVLGLLIVLLSAGLRLAVDYLAERTNRQELQAQHLLTELALLKTQLHPHFLFNTLNNIYALTLQQSARAPEAVLRLAEIMRYVLYESQADTVPLGRELTHLHGFLELQRLRLPNPATVQWEQHLPPGAEHAFPVAPMLLLPLVENAFKHGHLGAPAPAIRMALQLDAAGFLSFSVCNAVASVASLPDGPGGTGLINLRRRLELLYPERHTLTLTSTHDEHRATLQVQLRPMAIIF